MRNITLLKDLGWNKFLKPEQYVIKQLTNDNELPKVLTFYPQAIPSDINDSKKDEIYKKSVSILEQLSIDGVPLTDLYDLSIRIVSRNPHSYGVDKLSYVISAVKKNNISSVKQTVQEMVKNTLLMKENEGGESVVLPVNSPSNIIKHSSAILSVANFTDIPLKIETKEVAGNVIFVTIRK